VKEILGGVEKVLAEELPGWPITLVVEPGRGIAATAGAVSSRVMLRAPRADGEWLHLEAGYYQGLNEVLDHYVYPITVAGRSGPDTPYTLCGPTCDSTDTISKGQRLSRRHHRGGPAGVPELGGLLRGLRHALQRHRAASESLPRRGGGSELTATVPRPPRPRSVAC
jgi:ornithine decarboxylase